MNQIIPVLAAVLAAAVGAVAMSFSRSRRLKHQVKTARSAARTITRRAENLVVLQTRRQTIQQETAHEKTQLHQTDDNALITRANALFP